MNVTSESTMEMMNNQTKEKSTHQTTTNSEMIPVKLTVQDVQKLLKEQDYNLELLIEQAQQKFRDLKIRLLRQAKKNWKLEQEIEELEKKIELLVMNHQNAITMKHVLMGKVKSMDIPKKPRTDFSEYDTLFYLLRTQPQYLAALSRNVRGDCVYMFLETVVKKIFDEEKEEMMLLKLFEQMLKLEYDACINIGEFMRSNTTFTKMLATMLARTTYHQFLVQTLRDPITKLVNAKDVDMEINPATVYKQMVDELKSSGKPFDGPECVSTEVAMENEQVKKILEPRYKLIEEYSGLILDSIVKSVDKTPYGIRYMCKKILQYGRKRYPKASESEIYCLVGGFIFLRFFNPAIPLADVPKVGIVNTKLSKIQRKSLTFVTKTLQNLSNGVMFGTKEKFTIPLNKFLEANRDKIHQYFIKVCDVEDIDTHSSESILQELCGQTKTITLSLQELALIHNMCVENLTKISKPEEKFYQVVTKLLQQYGPPKLDENGKKLACTIKLRNPDKEGTLEKLLVDDEPTGVTPSKRIALILKDLPSIPTNVNVFISLLDTLRAGKVHSMEKDDLLFATRIKHELDYLEKIGAKLTAKPGEDKYAFLLQEIVEDIQSRNTRKKKLEQKVQFLEKALEEAQSRHSYLASQAQLYSSYLENALLKAFNPLPLSSKQPTLERLAGPHEIKISELEKQGVVKSDSVPENLLKTGKMIFTSASPGKIRLVIRGDGVHQGVDIELTDLLEKQNRGVQELEFQTVTLDTGLTICLLNKLFLLDKIPAKRVIVKQTKL